MILNANRYKYAHGRYLPHTQRPRLQTFGLSTFLLVELGYT